MEPSFQLQNTISEQARGRGIFNFLRFLKLQITVQASVKNNVFFITLISLICLLPGGETNKLDTKTNRKIKPPQEKMSCIPKQSRGAIFGRNKCIYYKLKISWAITSRFILPTNMPSQNTLFFNVVTVTTWRRSIPDFPSTGLTS